MPTEFCPQCATPRTGSFRYCRSCKFDYDTSAAPTTPAWPSPPPPLTPPPPPIASAWASPAALSAAPAGRSRAERIVIALIILVVIGGAGYLYLRSQVSGILSEVGAAVGSPRLSATPRPTMAAVIVETSAPCGGDDLTAMLEALQAGLLRSDLDDHYTTLADAKADALKVPYKTLFRDAETYDGEALYLEGEVIQTLYDQPFGDYCPDLSPLLDGDATVLRVNVTKDDYGYWSDTVYVVYLGTKVRVIEDDIVAFVGQGIGLVTYESTLGGSVTIPSVLVGKLLAIR